MAEVKRILIADTSKSITMTRDLTDSLAQVIEAYTLKDALFLIQHKAPHIDPIICNTHFDDSRMFDLLRIVKADPSTSSIPFFCFRSGGSLLSLTIFQALEIACKALGAIDFFDFHYHESKFGIEEANENFRQKINGLLCARKL